jgi:hypothetical protein
MAQQDAQKPSLFPLFLAIAILAITGWYGYSNYNSLNELNANLAQADEVLLDLEGDKTKALRDYQNSKKDYVDAAAANDEKLNIILPSAEDLTALTRLFDDFAFKNHYRNNPFFISQLSYGEIDENAELAYRVIPITMTLEASERNFFQFLEYVENSGSIENGIRLLAVNGITLQLQDDETETLTVQLSLQAYIQSNPL